MAGSEDKGTGADKPRPQTAKKAPAAKKAAPKAEKPTPESIGIEGTVTVGGHRLDDERGWVPEDEALPEDEED